MEKVATLIRLLILLLCAVLFLAGALWNLCMQPEMPAETIADTDIQQESVDVLFNPQETNLQDMLQHEQQTMEQRLAALRMERDTAWQQLYYAVESLEFAEKQQTLHQYAEMQYDEQKLELLFSAKGIEFCLVLLGEEQANIIISAEVLQQEYEKVFDLVLRNTTYDETQIVLVPME